MWKVTLVSVPSSFSYLHCVHLSHSIIPTPVDDTSFYLLFNAVLFFPFFPHTPPADLHDLTLTLPKPVETSIMSGFVMGNVSCNSHRWKCNTEQEKRTERYLVSACGYSMAVYYSWTKHSTAVFPSPPPISFCSCSSQIISSFQKESPSVFCPLSHSMFVCEAGESQRHFYTVWERMGHI